MSSAMPVQDVQDGIYQNGAVEANEKGPDTAEKCPVPEQPAGGAHSKTEESPNLPDVKETTDQFIPGKHDAGTTVITIPAKALV